MPPEWTPDQIGQFQQYWDSLLAGDLGQRRHTRFVPGGLEYHPTREVTLKDQFDEWLARVVCFAFSVSPSGFITQVNRATAQTAQQTAGAEGLQPLKLWVKSLVDRLIEEDFGWGDLEFGWAEKNAPDPATLMTINTGYVAAGIKTVDEARADIGLPPVAGGDKPPQIRRLFNPAEPRDERGRWTMGNGSSKKPRPYLPNIIPAFLEEPLEIPQLEEAPEPIKPIEPEKLPDPDPPSSMQKPTPIPNPDIAPGVERIPKDLTQEEKTDCRKQWNYAKKYCREVADGTKSGNNYSGYDIDSCMMGLVAYHCGVRPVSYDKISRKKKPKKLPRKPDLEA